MNYEQDLLNELENDYKQDLLNELENEQYPIHADYDGERYLVIYSWAPALSSIVDESNERALDRMFEGVEECKHLGDRSYNGKIGVSLAAPYTTLLKARGIIDGLAEYPIICDRMFSEVESEHACSLWDVLCEEEREALRKEAGNDRGALWSLVRDMLY